MTPQLRAFIIRPFGEKEGIDFDRVEEALLAPALHQVHVSGRTTLDILRQGNIRVDMFQRLLTADLVLADVSIHNANVFYELGIRHALREKRTFLLRCQASTYPFDLQTDRYFVYDKDRPAESLDGLVTALKHTLASLAQDSPVFHLLPGLTAQDPARFLPVPQEFQEAVTYAVAHKQFGDLELLAEEVQELEWARPGLRVVGRAQMAAKAYESARVTWEAVVKVAPDDVEGNTYLGTIYQRLGDLTRSDQALKRVLDDQDLDRTKRAEAHALLGRNAKTRWLGEWKGESDAARRLSALRSDFLEQSYHWYLQAFQADLNHFYSGLNALAMLTVLTELAAAQPDIWEERFEDEDEATLQLKRHQAQRQQLSAGVELSVKAALADMKHHGKTDVWADISQADLLCLTSTRPTRVVDSYRRALAKAQDFEVDSARQQLLVYQKLGVLTDNVNAALADPIFAGLKPDTPSSETPQRVVLFTGHMIDKPDRPEPRFPPEKEGVAREHMKQALLKERDDAGGLAFGLAGGASGGDLLFHDVCEELQIPTRLYLALPSDQFIHASVAPGGPDWVERFRRLYQQRLTQQSGTLSPSGTSVRVLPGSGDLPRWLQDKPDYTIWQRNNLWMLHNALVEGGAHVTVIALWNGEKGDGPGGTADLVAKAQQRGAKTIILDTKKLFLLS